MSEPLESTGDASATDLGRTSLALATLLVVALGLGLGAPLETAALVVSALVVVAALGALETVSLSRRALGSVGLVGGVTALVGVALTSSLAAVAVGALAVCTLGYALAADGPRAVVVRRVFRDSFVLAVVCGTTAGVLFAFAAVGTETFRTLFVQSLALLAPTPFVGLLTATCLFGLVLLLFDLASSVIDPWLPEGVTTPTPVTDVFGRLGSAFESFTSTLGSMSSEAREFLGVVLLFVGILVSYASYSALLLLPRAFHSVLESLGQFGVAIAWTLQSGALHALLVGAGVIALGANASRPVAMGGRLWLGSYPLRTLALGAGGALCGPLVVGVALFSPAVTAPFAVVGFAALLVGAYLALLFAPFTLRPVSDASARLPRYALTLGVATLCGAVALAALEGITPLVVFVAAAVSVLVWDLGENALTLRERLGRVDTRQVELVHATASGLVGALGIAVATLALYGLGHVPPPSERWQALAPLVLALAALVVFAAAVVLNRGVSSGLRGGYDWLRSSRVTSRLTGGAVLVLATSVALVALGYGHVVFFLFVFVVPFALLVFFDMSSNPAHDQW
ncbi:DUF7519 family protein [Natronobiforma cellulositropha]|uniref:DUF7519 family protein n=1 Tax=Natronobiforma cellulositropha TaxID=1679076 RepID=UPI0021D5F945|nr:hypothetical protein [Natronobiforma cellulositropha]